MLSPEGSPQVKAIRAVAGKTIFDEAHAPPAPAPGDAVVRPLRAAITEPDLDAASGAPPFTGILGHQFVGVVEHVEQRPGRDDKRWIGRRVVASPHVVCGQCERCRTGLATHCASRTVIGLFGRDGCFAERIAVPVANLVEVPRQVSDDAAVFAEPLARALHAAHILRVEGKPYVTVLGDGVDALLSAQVMARLNASVRLLGWQPDKFGLCERWGIKHRHADEVGRRNDQDIVVECTGAPRSIALAMSLARPRAKIVLRSRAAPIPQGHAATAPGPDLTPAILNELELFGARSANLAEGVEALAANRVETAPLITSRFKLPDGPAALSRARDLDQIRVVLEL